MLSFEDELRLLVIGDRAGTGKSALLQKLKFNCDYDHRVPVSLVLLEQNADRADGRHATTAIGFVDWLRKDLSKHVSFPRYDRLNDFRMSYVWAPFAQSLDSVLEGLEVAHVQINVESLERGAMVEGVHVDTVNLKPRKKWARPEQERLAIEKCIDAFLLDLRHAATSDPVVLLIDSYDRAQPGMDDWIVDDFIRPLLLAEEDSQRAERLLVVLAGHENKMPAFQQMLGERCGQLVASRRLSGWTRDHVREFLDLYNLDVSDRQLDFLYGEIQDGKSVKDAKDLAEFMMTQRGLAS